MRKAAISLCLATLIVSHDCLARGSFSSSGGRGGSFSSGRSSGGSARTYSSPRTNTVTRSTTVTRRSGGYYGGGHYGYGYGYHPMMYPGFGMDYGYSNGLIEGLIIGNMMHPAGTVAYTGGGYNGNALLYPDGTVVNQQGYQVGTYFDGQFAPVANGQMMAQPAPADAQQQMQQQVKPAPVQVAQPVPVTIYSGWDIAGGVIIAVLVIAIFIAIL